MQAPAADPQPVAYLLVGAQGAEGRVRVCVDERRVGGGLGGDARVQVLLEEGAGLGWLGPRPWLGSWSSGLAWLGSSWSGSGPWSWPQVSVGCAELVGEGWGEGPAADGGVVMGHRD